MREVLISIQPKWVEKICRKEKTVEVRKTKPKCEVPFKCYIYMTMGKCPKFVYNEKLEKQSIYEREPNTANGKVIGEFVCDRIVKFENSWYDPAFAETSDLSCVGFEELAIYIGKKDFGYGWHITDLVVYDEPRELREFAKPAKNAYDNEGCLLCDGCEFANWNIERVCTIDFCPERMITRPPQSWQFCEATEPRQTAD